MVDECSSNFLNAKVRKRSEIFVFTISPPTLSSPHGTIINAISPPSLQPCHCLRSGSFGLHVVPLVAWHSSPKDQDSLRTSPQRITKIDKRKTNLQMSWDRTLKPKSFTGSGRKLSPLNFPVLSVVRFPGAAACDESCVSSALLQMLE